MNHEDNSGNIAKVVSIIDSFKTSKSGMNLQKISEITGINKATAYRICKVLVDHNVLFKDNVHKIYKIGPKFLEWTMVFREHLSAYVEVEDILRSISNEINETVTIFKRIGFERECLFRHEVKEQLRYTIEPGERLPLNRGAGGKVILAFFDSKTLQRYMDTLKFTKKEREDFIASLERIRENGFYFSYGERSPYAAAFSVPLFDKRGTVFGSLSVSGPIERFKERFKEKHVSFVKAKALDIQILLTATGEE